MKKIICFTPAWGAYAEDFKRYVKPTYEHDFKRLEAEGYEIERLEMGFEKDEIHTKLMIITLRQLVIKSSREESMVFMAAPGS